MVTVKTKDWGIQFAHLSNHIAAKSTALQRHSTELDDEISNHTGHAFSRHGFQADWISQLIRVITGITPDQTFSPTGVEAVIREWNVRWIGSDTGQFSQLVDTFDASGNTVIAPKGGGFTPTVYATAMGLDSGGFISPEAQMKALDRAQIIAATAAPFKKVEHPGINSPWKDLNKLMVVVDASPSLGYGIGYTRKTDGSFQVRTRDEILQLVEVMELGKTRAQAGFADTGASLIGPGGVKLRAEGARPAFSGVSDLLDYLGVSAVWQKTALVIFKRDNVNAPWKRVTMYPCNLVGAGWAPGNKIQGKPWSGKVKRANNVISTLPVPTWRPA